ncbi:uncharacterized protein LOC143137640 isoform X2 [Alosa pseudoharengus]|uniref:uncharacterized protein LOC143137640 isoform X2 n=1 Tax=Alosa pseudoharengus TaxID=34774 RepID=UPI003F8A425E
MRGLTATVTLLQRVDFLTKVGNQSEAENCRNARVSDLEVLEKCTVGKTLADWKNKFSPDLVQKLDEYTSPYPENTLGLLRFIRNLYEHYPDEAEKIDLTELFPDLLATVYMFVEAKKWNLRPLLNKFFPS